MDPSRWLRCDCERFEAEATSPHRCARCGTERCFFRAGEEPPAAADSAAPGNPTPEDLVWGSRTGGARALGSRLGALQHLTCAHAPGRAAGADLAGGAGRCLATLAQPFECFFHADLSLPALQRAAKRHADRSNVVYVRDDLRAPQPALREIDVAYSVDTFLYAGDFVPLALAHARALLRDGGVLIAEFPNLGRARLASYWKGRERRGPERSFSHAEAREMAELAGFQRVAEFALFKELGFRGSRALDRAGLAGAAGGLCTWFYLVLQR